MCPLTLSLLGGLVGPWPFDARLAGLHPRRRRASVQANIDALGFRKGKDAELRQMAKFLIDKARTSGTPQEIGPLNPYARRIVHMAVAEDATASSESVGDAFLKTVIITARR